MLLRQYFSSHAQLQRLLEKHEVSSNCLQLFLLVIAHFTEEHPVFAAIKCSTLLPLIDLPYDHLINLLHVLRRLLPVGSFAPDLLLPLEPGLALRHFVKLALLFH